MLHHAQVVRDEEQREAEALLQIVEQVQDLRLDRDVERRDGLVGDDEARLDGERAGDADALALPAAELVRVAHRHVGRQPDQVEQLAHPLAPLLARADVMDREALADDARRPACAG